MIERGADVHAVDRVSTYTYCTVSAFTSVRLFFHHYACIRFQSGHTPLHYVVISRALHTAALLIEKGANIDAVDNVRFNLYCTYTFNELPQIFNNVH